MTQPVALGEPLTLEAVERVALGAPVTLGDGARGRMRASRDVIERAVAGGEIVYGVTTGFGALADTRIDPSQAATLQRGIVARHVDADDEGGELGHERLYHEAIARADPAA